MVKLYYAAAILCCLSQYIQAQQQSFAASVTSCPKLSARQNGPKNAFDVRPDDIKVIASLGDSFMTGFAADGVRGSLYNISTYYESRDVSFATGGRSNSMTLANAFKHYSGSGFRGASTKERFPTFCTDLQCPIELHNSTVDNLNAALDIAWSSNLNQELDYLIPEMKRQTGSRYNKDWKMIVIQVGNSDICHSCNDNYSEEFGTGLYYARLDQAIGRIRREIPRVIVNVVGSIKLSSVFKKTRNQDYCQRLKVPSFGIDLSINRLTCECALNEANWSRFDALGQDYDRQFAAVYGKYKGLASDLFGLMYTPARFDPIDWPLEMFNNLDCLHPSVLGHQWIATALWNMLFVKQSQIPEHIGIMAGQVVYCPSPSDRLQLL